MKPVSGKHFCKILERNGWVLQRVRGSHHIYTKPGEQAVPAVPVHGNRDLKIGLQAHLMKATGLTEADL